MSSSFFSDIVTSQFFSPSNPVEQLQIAVDGRLQVRAVLGLAPAKECQRPNNWGLGRKSFFWPRKYMGKMGTKKWWI